MKLKDTYITHESDGEQILLDTARKKLFQYLDAQQIWRDCLRIALGRQAQTQYQYIRTA